MQVTKRDGSLEPLDINKYQSQIEWACKGLDGVEAKTLKDAVHQSFYEGILTSDLNKNLERTAQELATPGNPNWTFAAARFVLQDIYKEIAGSFTYPSLSEYLDKVIAESNLNPLLKTGFDLERLNAAIKPENDYLFDYLGMSTLKDRYLLRNYSKKLVEMPQHFFMRVAMGVAIDELKHGKKDANEIALGYYTNLFSPLRFMSSTPTLFNSGLNKSQLSSCFGISMGDDFNHIWDSLREAGAYSKYGGGVAIDYTPIRAKGSPIRSMGGEAGGPVPYIKMFNDTLIGFDQQGKRKGSGAPYMEPWHAGFLNFLDLREPGDDRIRTHDLFPANWIPDLFMKRMQEGSLWSLFDPADTPDLHDSWGEDFETKYEAYEAKGLAKQIVSSTELWEKMLARLLAHGVFWHCYKDRMNERYPMKKYGVIRSSNLCTEIALMSNDDVSFVCNLGSINLSRDEFLLTLETDTVALAAGRKWKWNKELSKVAMHGIRFLDSVISVGYVPSERGRKMQEQHRPIGMGVMGWTEALYKMGIDYESREHVEYANEVLKQISIAATYQSAKLAAEKGSFPLFEHSTWAEGILTHETLVNRSVVDKYELDLTFDHCPFVKESELKAMVAKGMRNSNLLAIAPTATISNIVGTEQCTELPFERSFTKKNLSGTFKTTAKILAANRHGLPIKTAYEINHQWTVWSAAARQVWIDQSQSTNFFINTNKEGFGDEVSTLYQVAWEAGLKTTYYCYGQSEETSDVQQAPMELGAKEMPEPELAGPACFLRPGDAGFSGCEACQ
jgi:ribonucleoside-diphosphate reductase alpha chain